MTLVDAGPLVALLDRRDGAHARCVRAAAMLTAPFLTTWPAFTEAAYILGAKIGWPAQDKLWRLALREDLLLHTLDAAQLRRACDLMKKYRDLPMDLADATLVALAEAKRLTRVFTLDKDFHHYRLPGRKSFEVVP